MGGGDGFADRCGAVIAGAGFLAWARADGDVVPVGRGVAVAGVVARACGSEAPTGRTKEGSSATIRNEVSPPGWRATTVPSVSRAAPATPAAWSALARHEVAAPLRCRVMGRG